MLEVILCSYFIVNFVHFWILEGRLEKSVISLIQNFINCNLDYSANADYLKKYSVVSVALKDSIQFDRKRTRVFQQDYSAFIWQNIKTSF